jgi:Holliday junction resolvase RusA-like endonuclease
MPIIDLPLPPSTNSLWRSNRGRVHRSSGYEAWRKSAGCELKLQRPPRVDGPVEVSIALGRPDNRKRDLDNAAGKAVLDLLVTHQVITDDSLVTSITSRWDTEVPPGRAIIIVRSAIAVAEGASRTIPSLPQT